MVDYGLIILLPRVIRTNWLMMKIDHVIPEVATNNSRIHRM